MKISKELIKGSTAMLVLNIINKEDMYGYKIIRVLEMCSDGAFSMNEGTLYPILHALENEGYVESYPEKIDGRTRKYYHISKKGKKQLNIKKEEWNVFSSAVGKVLDFA